MNKVISINLGGRAYQIEEEGFNLLRDYLQEAKEKLNNDPDKEEIVGDLEQAVAERLNRLLTNQKNVITISEIKVIVKEMGPVEGGDEGSDKKAETKKTEKRKKRLYRIREGKVIAGVCTGLAAYFDVDVVLVRIIFVLLGLLTQGAAVIIYIIMIFVIPRAESPAEMAAAYGDNKTAQELIKQAREEFKDFTSKSEWKKWKYEMKHRLRQQRQERRMGKYGSDYGIFRLVILFFVIFWIMGLVSIITKGMVWGIMIPATWPLWATILGWIFFYQLIIEPLSCMGKCGAYYGNRRSFSGGIFSIFWLIFFGWLVWHFFPGSHQYFHQGYEMFQRGVSAIKNG